MVWILPKLSNYQQVAPSVRTGGSRHTGLAAPPHRNIHSYHPNYISTLLHREVGKSFSEILLEQRMERAVCLLRGTNLPVEEIASMLGYSNSSNFYKAFRKYYHQSPREFVSSAPIVCP